MGSCPRLRLLTCPKRPPCQRCKAWACWMPLGSSLRHVRYYYRVVGRTRRDGSLCLLHLILPCPPTLGVSVHGLPDPVDVLDHLRNVSAVVVEVAYALVGIGAREALVGEEVRSGRSILENRDDYDNFLAVLGAIGRKLRRLVTAAPSIAADVLRCTTVGLLR